MRVIKWLIRLVPKVALFGLVGFVCLVGSVWLDQNRETTLPTPTGPFAVGRSIYDWVDENSFDVLAPAPGIKRELLLWIWYPATAGPSG